MLLDEVEKAHPDVFNILLQVLEDGRLTDSQGRTVDFRNTVVVMTSNLGSDTIQEITQNRAFDSISFDGVEEKATEIDLKKISDPTHDNNSHKYEAMKEAVMEVVTGHFRPEFINRIDEVVVFHPLASSQIRGIASIQLARLSQRLKERDLSITITDEVLNKLSDAGFDPVYGARPLKRAIQQMIENPLAHAVLSGKFLAGDTIVTTLDGESIRFEKMT